MSTALLPPHTEATATGFDPDADVAALKATPKEPTQPEPDPAPTADPPPAGQGGAGPTPEGGATPEGGGDGPTGNDAKASAKEFIEVYDILQSYGFSMYSQGMDPQKFQLPPYAKDRAAHHLAKGLEQMGTPELPWWVGLLIALAPPAGINFMTAKAHREAAERKAEEAATRNAQRQQRGEVLHPDSVIHPNGQEEPIRRASRTNTPPPPSVRTIYKDRAPMPPCQVCGAPCKSRNKKYCSKSCSGKARAKDRQQPSTTTTPQPPAQS